ncbi:hypothetical protein BJ508DRAFT_332832 [Ascobolus immersus RN42]|uniref:Uncharacterized protein n=1 Tax=Ascobolus immersus RN42 TaxID=1160509 RepID=A0A3N4HNZ8_ASCIM|nr:hypothetical protein BJ508DRAFT_332832 [Ascobolus immersus RN42]
MCPVHSTLEPLPPHTEAARSILFNALPTFRLRSPLFAEFIRTRFGPNGVNQRPHNQYNLVNKVEAYITFLICDLEDLNADEETHLAVAEDLDALKMDIARWMRTFKENGAGSVDLLGKVLRTFYVMIEGMKLCALKGACVPCEKPVKVRVARRGNAEDNVGE